MTSDKLLTFVLFLVLSLLNGDIIPTLFPTSQKCAKGQIVEYIYIWLQVLVHEYVPSCFLSPAFAFLPHLPSPTTEPTPLIGHHTSGLPTTIFLLAFNSYVEDQPWPFNDLLAFLAGLLVTCYSDDWESCQGPQLSWGPVCDPYCHPVLAQLMAPSPGRTVCWHWASPVDKKNTRRWPRPCVDSFARLPCTFLMVSLRWPSPISYSPMRKLCLPDFLSWTLLSLTCHLFQTSVASGEDS